MGKMSLPRKVRDALRSSLSSRLESELLQSLFMQDRPARTFRVDAVIQLSVEYAAASGRHIFCSAFGRQAVEYVMLGDWKEARRAAGYLRFEEDEHLSYREELAKNWETFVAMVDSICDEAKRIEAGGEHHRHKN
jgi:hypothetical protein